MNYHDENSNWFQLLLPTQPTYIWLVTLQDTKVTCRTILYSQHSLRASSPFGGVGRSHVRAPRERTREWEGGGKKGELSFPSFLALLARCLAVSFACHKWRAFSQPTVSIVNSTRKYYILSFIWLLLSIRYSYLYHVGGCNVFSCFNFTSKA